MKPEMFSLIKALRKDSNRSFSVLSEEANIPTTTFFDNFVRLQDQGVITKSTVLFDFKKLGFFYRVFLMLKSGDRKSLENYLANHSNLNSLFKINNFDYFADTVFPSVKEFHDFLEELDSNDVEYDYHEVIDQLKIEGFMS